jgi:hypothetical protein
LQATPVSVPSAATIWFPKFQLCASRTVVPRLCLNLDAFRDDMINQSSHGRGVPESERSSWPKMRDIVKVVAAIVLVLLLFALALFTLAGGWYTVPRMRHFQSVARNADFTAVVRSAAEVIGKSGAGRTTNYYGSTLTNLPKPIADLEPEYVSVVEGGMLISFARGAEGFGLKIFENDDAWVIFSYPYRPQSQLVELAFKKDPKTGKPVGPANESLPTGSETNSTSSSAGFRR